MTVFFTSDEIIIKRYRQTGSGINRLLSATFTTYEADIQPIAAERVDLFGGRVGKTYQAFVNPDTPVEEGDVVQVVDTGKRYAVKAVSTYEGAGLLDHRELILMAQD